MHNTSKSKLKHIQRKWYCSGAIVGGEILTFSTKQLYSQVNNPRKWDNDSTFLRVFYNGMEITDRRLATNKERNPWEDSEEVFIGVIDKSKITYEEVSQYELFCELRDVLE